eukprot:CAMPEP_0196152236 /NCGR_PEP_ID=MMETSP0910-20130528/35143_1 /TAXON_ID=49265 /ORGANISM="Thalassiosira rotula, Strain GSO102" /LENGTH=553 /DNA_ID=CAMNT_0041415781 /DNA_START=8 /DNA_END=1669 /DNA_ORIENTATION=-
MERLNATQKKMEPEGTIGRGTKEQRNDGDGGAINNLLRRSDKRRPCSNRRSLKLFLIAIVVYVISIQFRSAFVTLPLRSSSSPESSHYDASAFAPPGARRWKSLGRGSRDDSIDEDAPINLRVRGGNDIAMQHDNKQTSPSRRFPRMIAINYEKKGSIIHSTTPLKIFLPDQPINFEEDSIPREGPPIHSSWYEPNADEFIDGYDWDVCEPMAEWQLQSYPTCNNFHELDLPKIRMINKGGARIAFELKQHLDGEEIPFVYKTIRYNKEVTMKLVEEQRKDSVVLERTTSSGFIPDIHGYCSLGVMMDFMPEGNMHDYIKGARLAGGSTLPPVDRLRLAIHIATSVADLHTIDNTPMPSIFHNDICCHQYLFQNGVFKLNDFNYARPIYINKKRNEQCTRTSFGMKMWKARSLEEHQYNLDSPDFKPVKPDKIDVWMMGNLIYYMLTDLYTFEKPENLKWQEVGRELMAGRRSPLPKDIYFSEDPSHVAMKKALDMCWTQEPDERPSARSISDYLIGRLREVTGEDDPDFRVVLPKRDPNQRNTESDYEKNND